MREQMGEDINRSYYKYWGKAKKSGQSSPYHLLVYHCLDAAMVGKIIINDHLRRRKTTLSIDESGNEMISILFIFFLILHDLGKFSINFQNLRPDLLKIIQGITSKREYTIRHDQLGWIVYDNFLKQDLLEKLPEGINKCYIEKIFDIFALCSFGHHGKPPVLSNDMIRLYFTDDDKTAMLDFVHDCLDILIQNTTELFKNMGDSQNSFIDALKRLSWELSGIMVISDWIASGDDFIHHSDNLLLSDYKKTAEEQAVIAVQKAGILPSSPSPQSGLSRIFPAFAKSPTPLQKYCNDAIIENKPQMWILEDVTGSGKTEAALTLASRIISNRLADGVFIALPTMATSNAMYERMSGVYYRLFDEKGKPSLVLSHGARYLSDKFRQSYREHIITDIFDEETLDESIEEGGAYCAKWLADSSKKALLADTGVGTIDQVLLAVLPVKYQSLRYYGMCRKVLIIDEVHSYDAYMLRILETVLKGHAAAGGSVIMLSATLPFSIREKLVSAYRDEFNETIESVKLKETGYPLATCVIKEHGIIEKVLDTRHEVERTVRVQFIEDSIHAIEIIKKTIQNKQCACWIRNTVNDVFAAYDALKDDKSIPSDDITIFHSRFALCDRIQIENRVIANFGNGSTHETRKGKIILATQVVEQSLDLDFDVIITDLAPIDLVIQRAGRLHRHLRDEKGNRIEYGTHSRRSAPVLYVHIPPETQNPDKAWFSSYFKGASFVYKDHSLLWRTKEILKREKSIVMPKKARLLIESVYGDTPIIAPDVFLESENRRFSDQMSKEDEADFNALKLTKGYSTEASQRWDEEERVHTRSGNEQMVAYLYKIADGEIIPAYQDDHAWDMSSIKVRKHAINIQPDEMLDKKIHKIKKKHHLSFNSIFINYDTVIQSIDGKNISYDTMFGLRISREEE
jgi:CRISPR-associated endonuclease/helicase Cas3